LQYQWYTWGEVNSWRALIQHARECSTVLLESGVTDCVSGWARELSTFNVERVQRRPVHGRLLQPAAAAHRPKPGRLLVALDNITRCPHGQFTRKAEQQPTRLPWLADLQHQRPHHSLQRSIQSELLEAL
jgi:hypothetical protein